MTTTRITFLVTLATALLLTAAIVLTAGGLPLVGFSGRNGLWSGLDTGGWNLAFPATTSASPLALFAAGWCCRWVYGLPWSDLPRGLLNWVLGWRRIALLTLVATGCLAILIFL